MPPSLHRFLLRLFGRLPRQVRRRLVRWGAPSYTVGAICVIRRPDGHLLLVSQAYRNRWGLPGGLMSRGEIPSEAVRREVREEVGLEVEVGSPTVVVEPDARRVDVVFAGTPVAGQDVDGARSSSPEIVDVRWFAPDDLPPLQEETTAALEALARVEGAAGAGGSGHRSTGTVDEAAG